MAYKCETGSQKSEKCWYFLHYSQFYWNINHSIHSNRYTLIILICKVNEKQGYLQDEVILEDLADHHWDLYFATSVAIGPFYPTGIK